MSLSQTAVSAKETLPASPPAILHALERFRQMGSVLYIAAHPDDENTELLTYLARGRKYRTAYLSLTRGDGGQNVLSPDLGEKLGVARTQELLAARQLDGAQQFFTRAVDFGFSKSYEETLDNWNKLEVLSDVVRIIRKFRPDIVIARFSPSPGGTHGHHTASTVLAAEAFKLAADSKAFPEQKLPPWRAKRLLWNVSRWQLDKAAGLDSFKIDVGGKDSVSGERFVEIAEKSRAMHKTQGFDTFHFPGGKDDPRQESFHLLDGDAASTDIMEGVDTTWSRVPGAAKIAKDIDTIVAQFKSQDSASSVPALLNLRKELSRLPNDPIISEKKEELDRILQACLGLTVETTIAKAEVVPGEELDLRHKAVIHSSVPVRWMAVRFPSTGQERKIGKELRSNDPQFHENIETLPVSTALTQPYWLRKEGTPGTYHVDDPEMIGTAEDLPSFPIEHIFEIDNSKLIVKDEPVQETSKQSASTEVQRLKVIPPVALRFASDLVLLPPESSRQIEVELSSYRDNVSGSLSLQVPPDWTVEPKSELFSLHKSGDRAKIRFTVSSPKKSSTAKLVASAEIQKIHYKNQREEVKYAHLPTQLLQPQCAMKAVSLEVAKRGHKIGYIQGAGDSLPENIKELGYELVMLEEATLSAEQLKDIDAVVLGVRAFNVREKIGHAMPVLFDYVKNGGTVIVQYNRPDGLKATPIAPYDLHISADRTTDEKAAISFLAPESKALNVPNKLSSSDFDNWVQERGLYFPDKWDEHFTPIISCGDKGETPSKGVLLIAKYGNGSFVYTGLSLFRQLPAGVPGAYRLLANLLSLSK